jgi:hypothetical protein
LLLILGKVRQPQTRVLIYAWNPLVIYELFYSGHLESFMLPPLLGFIYLFLRGRHQGAGAALGLATAIKLVPALFLVVIPHGMRLKIVSAFASVVILTYLFYAGAGEKILGFLPIYFSDPYEIFNLGPIQSGLFWLANFFSLPFIWMRYVLLLILLAVLIAIARRPHARPEDLVEKIYLALSGYLLLIYPAFHPWYLCPLVAVLCLTPSRSWIYFSLALPLSYLKYVESDGNMPAWVTWAQFAPLYALLALEFGKTSLFNERRFLWYPGPQTPSSTPY